MGGYGSGQRWGASKPLTTSQNRLDVLWMKRQGYLREGYGGSIHWTCNGEPAGDIKFASEKDAIRLVYKSRRRGEEWQSVDYMVQLDWSDCRFGGKRPYFLCPVQGCGKKVQHLYAGNPYFVCRHCMHLAYPSQNEQAYDRAARRADKLLEKLDAADMSIFDGPVPIKPKGMHWKTFEKLQNEQQYYANKALLEFSSRFGDIGL